MQQQQQQHSIGDDSSVGDVSPINRSRGVNSNILDGGEMLCNLNYTAPSGARSVRVTEFTKDSGAGGNSRGPDIELLSLIRCLSLLSSLHLLTQFYWLYCGNLLLIWLRVPRILVCMSILFKDFFIEFCSYYFRNAASAQNVVVSCISSNENTGNELTKPTTQQHKQQLQQHQPRKSGGSAKSSFGSNGSRSRSSGSNATSRSEATAKSTDVSQFAALSNMLWSACVFVLSGDGLTTVTTATAGASVEAASWWRLSLASIPSVLASYLEISPADDGSSSNIGSLGAISELPNSSLGATAVCVLTFLSSFFLIQQRIQIDFHSNALVDDLLLSFIVTAVLLLKFPQREALNRFVFGATRAHQSFTSALVQQQQARRKSSTIAMIFHVYGSSVLSSFSRVPMLLQVIFNANQSNSAAAYPDAASLSLDRRSATAAAATAAALEAAMGSLSLPSLLLWLLPPPFVCALFAAAAEGAVLTTATILLPLLLSEHQGVLSAAPANDYKFDSDSSFLNSSSSSIGGSDGWGPHELMMMRSSTSSGTGGGMILTLSVLLVCWLQYSLLAFSALLLMQRRQIAASIAESLSNTHRCRHLLLLHSSGDSSTGRRSPAHPTSLLGGLAAILALLEESMRYAAVPIVATAAATTATAVDSNRIGGVKQLRQAGTCSAGPVFARLCGIELICKLGCFMINGALVLLASCGLMGNRRWAACVAVVSFCSALLLLQSSPSKFPVTAAVTKQKECR